MSVYKICIVGEAESGKTSFIGALKGAKHDVSYAPTTQVEFHTNRGDITIDFLDMRSTSANADGYIIMADFSDGEIPLGEIIKWRNLIKSNVTYVLSKDDRRIINGHTKSGDGSLTMYSTSIYHEESLYPPVTEAMRKITGDNGLKILYAENDSSSRPAKRRRVSM